MSGKRWHRIASLWDWFDRLHSAAYLVPGLSLVISWGGITAFVSGIWSRLAFAEILGLTVGVALGIAGLILIAQLILDRLGRPRIIFDFDPTSASCVASVFVRPFSAPAVNTPGMYYRALVELKSRRPLKGCRGFLKLVCRRTDGKWAPTALRDALDLRWATRDFSPIELRPEIPQYLDVFWIDELDKEIRLPVHHTSNATLDLFNEKTAYRLDIVLSAEDGRSWPLSIQVETTNEWNAPLVKVISTP